MPNTHKCTVDDNHSGLSEWRVKHTETLLEYNADIIAGVTPTFLVAEQLDTDNNPVIHDWVDAYLSYDPDSNGGDPVFEDAGYALSTTIVHPRTNTKVVNALILANHFTRAQYATRQLDKTLRPHLVAELADVYTRSSREALQVMTDLVFDADANGLALTALYADEIEPGASEKHWIEIYTHCLSLIGEDPMPLCVIDPTITLLMGEREVVQINMSSFRRPLLSMVTDSLWMLVHDRDS